MVRTRDLVLFLICAAFLLVGIGITGLSQLFTIPSSESVVQFDATAAPTTTAEAVETTLDRQQQLHALQAKLAARGDVVSAPVTDTVVFASSASESESVEVLVDASDEVEVSGVQYCDTVSTVSRPWPAALIETVEREGRRVYLTETTQVVPTLVGTTTTEETMVTENIYTHLPIRTSAGQPTCIGQDVIGIAQDGSLLRNDNYAAYSIFGSETLIGHALDGLPVYGVTTTVVTDACGGALMNGQYRYYLSTERPGILGCFAAQPVTL